MFGHEDGFPDHDFHRNVHMSELAFLIDLGYSEIAVEKYFVGQRYYRHRFLDIVKINGTKRP